MGSNDGGFDFDLVKRNALLERKGVPPPSAWKTGTTIAGVVYKVTARACCRLIGAQHGRAAGGSAAAAHARRRVACSAALRASKRPCLLTPAPSLSQDGVVLGADTRSTSGSTVADKNCEKIHYIAPNVYCCGAGTAADTMNVTAMVSSALDLHRYATGRESRVATALTMLKTHLFKCVRAAVLADAVLARAGSGAALCARLADRLRCCLRGSRAQILTRCSATCISFITGTRATSAPRWCWAASTSTGRTSSQ